MRTFQFQIPEIPCAVAIREGEIAFVYQSPNKTRLIDDDAVWEGRNLYLGDTAYYPHTFYSVEAHPALVEYFKQFV